MTTAAERKLESVDFIERVLGMELQPWQRMVLQRYHLTPRPRAKDLAQTEIGLSAEESE